MKRCPASHLPVEEKPEWIASHPENDYSTVFRLIGNDIIHFFHRSSSSEIALASIDARKFLAILQNLNLTHIPVYLLVDFEKVTNISYHYSKNFLNFAFNWGRNIRMVVLYNVRDETRNGLERLCQIAPETMCMIIAGSYRDGMEMIIGMKNRRSPGVGDEKAVSGPEALKKELLAAMTRISLLQMFNQELHPPAVEDDLYPFFLAVETFRKNMMAKELLYQERKKELQKNCEHKLNEVCRSIEAENAKHSAQANSHKNLVLSLSTDIERHEMELQKLKTTEEEILASAERLLNKIEMPDSDKRIEHLRKSFEDKAAPEPSLSTLDTLFLEKLKERHPNLNSKELKLCLLIRRNNSTRNIASMQATSRRGIESIRYQLHKKLGLEKHQSMKTYLGNI